MSAANVNERASIERVYPRDRFLQDAGRNAVGAASVLHGVRIMSQPDESGGFELVTADRQTGERDPEGDTVFLPPFLAGDAAALAPGAQSALASEEMPRAPPEAAARDREYDAFVDRVLEAARTITFKSPDGQDERLRGFRGG